MSTPYVPLVQGDRLTAEDWNRVQLAAQEELAQVEAQLEALMARSAAVEAQLAAGLVTPRTQGPWLAEPTDGATWTACAYPAEVCSHTLLEQPTLSFTLRRSALVQLDATVEVQLGVQRYAQFIVGSGGLFAPARVPQATNAGLGRTLHQQHLPAYTEGWTHTREGVTHRSQNDWPTLASWPVWLEYHDAFLRQHGRWPLCGELMDGATEQVLEESVELPAGDYTVTLAFFAGAGYPSNEKGAPTQWRNLTLRAVAWNL